MLLELKDMNNDGINDVVVTDNGSNNFVVYFGRGDGILSSLAASFEVVTALRGLAIGDLNNDSILDVIVANENSNNIGVRLGNCDGSFGDLVVDFIQGQSRLFVVETVDFNLDENIDVVLAAYNSNGFCVVFGNGSGGFNIM